MTSQAMFQLAQWRTNNLSFLWRLFLAESLQLWQNILYPLEPWGKTEER
jgi:hypothetical protein